MRGPNRKYRREPNRDCKRAKRLGPKTGHFPAPETVVLREQCAPVRRPVAAQSLLAAQTRPALLGSFGQSAFANLRVNTEILSRVRENRRKMTVIYSISLKLGENV